MMSLPRYVYSLSVAGVGVSLTCDSDRLAEGFRRRYRAFFMEGNSHLTAHVRWDKTGHRTALSNPEVIFQSGVATLSAPGYAGFVDVERGLAELSLSSPQPVEGIEYWLRVIFALLVFQQGGLLVHGAGIARNGRGYIFFGRSGSGKTTVSRLSPNEVVLNDDLVVLMPRPEGWRVYGTPFWNPTQVKPTARSASLSAMFHLVQDQEVFLEPMKPSQALAELVANVPVIPTDPQRSGKVVERCIDLLRDIPIHRLHFLPDESFWRVIDTRK